MHYSGDNRVMLMNTWLNRRDAVALAPAPQAYVEEQLEQIVSNLRKSVEDSGNSYYQHGFYVVLGKTLIGFVGINNSERYFSGLLARFGQLGRIVGNFTRKYQDCGLEENEFSWLGSLPITDLSRSLELAVTANNGGFSPAENLANLVPIQDCTGAEKLALYLNYVSGKQAAYKKDCRFGAIFK